MAMLLGNEIRRLVSGVPIDGLAMGATTVFPIFSKTVVITRVVLRLAVVAGFSAVPTIKVEKSPATADVFSAEALTGVTVVGDTWTFNAEARGVTIPSGVPVDVTVTVAGTGTTYSLLADVFGYVIY